jgi:hypothetical protein
VVVALGRRTSSGAYEWWDGTTWVTNIFFRMSTLDSVAGAWRLSGLPAGGDLVDGAYAVRAVAFDNNNQSTTVQTYFSLDRVKPVITVTTPANGATLSGFSLIGGTVVDSGSGIRRVDVVLKRLSDGFRWAYTEWLNKETGNQATVSNTNWGLNTNLPSGDNLPDGLYEIKGVAFDKANNVDVDIIQVTINKGTARVSGTGVSATLQSGTSEVQLSTIIPSGRDSIITMTFTGPLDATTASDKRRYFIAVNGNPVAAESAVYNAKSNTVTLVMTDSTLREGDEIQVSWSGLLDTGGKAVPSTAPPVYVEEE